MLAGCSRGDSAAADVPHDWIRVDAGSAFSVMAPPGSVYRPGQGTDSLVGSVDVPGFELRFDYGLYSNPLAEPDWVGAEVEIDGKAARLVTSRSGSVGVHFPQVADTSLGATRLTVTCDLEARDHAPTVERIYRTIRFGR